MIRRLAAGILLTLAISAAVRLMLHVLLTRALHGE